MNFRDFTLQSTAAENGKQHPIYASSLQIHKRPYGIANGKRRSKTAN
jgi:hypothetical protein